MTHRNRVTLLVLGQILLVIGIMSALINGTGGALALGIGALGWIVSLGAAQLWSGRIPKRIARFLDIIDIAMPADLNADDDPNNLPVTIVWHGLSAAIAAAMLAAGLWLPFWELIVAGLFVGVMQLAIYLQARRRCAGK